MKLYPVTPNTKDVVIQILRDLPEIMAQAAMTSPYWDGITERRGDAKFGDVWYHTLVEDNNGDLEIIISECLDDIGANTIIRATVKLPGYVM